MGNIIGSSLKVEGKHLLKERKLILFVDLDETLVHTSEYTSHKAAVLAVAQSTHDARYIRLRGLGNHYDFLATEIRPWARQFLEDLSPLFKMYVTTFGGRKYAKEIRKILDPEKKILQRRIFSREYFEKDQTKDKVIEKFFSTQNNLPFIAIDDRGDVWNRKHNVVCVQPYEGSSYAATEQLIIEENTYLKGLAKTLKHIHAEFFSQYDDIQQPPPMQEIKNHVRQLILKDVNIHYIGKDEKKVYLDVIYLGATIHEHIITKEDASGKGISATTHILTTSPPSFDLQSFAEQNGIHLLKVTWIKSCNQMFRRVDEKHFKWKCKN